MSKPAVSRNWIFLDQDQTLRFKGQLLKAFTKKNNNFEVLNAEQTTSLQLIAALLGILKHEGIQPLRQCRFNVLF